MFSNHAKSSKSNKTDNQTPDLIPTSLLFMLFCGDASNGLDVEDWMISTQYPLVICYIAIENRPLSSLIYLLKMVDRSIVFRECLPEGHFSRWSPTFAGHLCPNLHGIHSHQKKHHFIPSKAIIPLALRPSFFPFPCGGSLKCWSPKPRGEYSSGLILDDLGGTPHFRNFHMFFYELRSFSKQESHGFLL